MEGSRRKILEILQETHNSTVGMLVKSMGLADATVRRHLDILKNDGLVDYTLVHLELGRPEHSYHLTEIGQEAMPKGYERFLGELIGELAIIKEVEAKGLSGDQLLELVIKRISDRKCESSAEESDGESHDRRLAVLSQLLLQEQFSPEARVSSAAISITLHNCPFRSVAMRTNALCSYDSNIISTVLGMNVERSECIRDGNNSCTYTANL